MNAVGGKSENKNRLNTGKTFGSVEMKEKTLCWKQFDVFVAMVIIVGENSQRLVHFSAPNRSPFVCLFIFHFFSEDLDQVKLLTSHHINTLAVRFCLVSLCQRKRKKNRFCLCYK